MNIGYARVALFAFTIVAYAVVGAIAAATGLSIPYADIASRLILVSGILTAGIVYTSLRGMVSFRIILETLFCGLLLVVPVGVSTYLAMGANQPLADGLLVRLDEAFGFNWREFIAFVDSRPVLANILGTAYQSFAIQLLVIPLLLVCFGKHLRAYMMIIAYGGICFLASVISIWFPALGTYTIYGVAASSLDNINAYFGYAFLNEFNAVRNDPNFIFSLENMEGILTFPSVHAAIAMLCAWAMWDVRWLRYPFLALNIAMAISAVSHANHYLVDVIAGVGLAIAVIALLNAAFKRQPKPEANPELAPAYVRNATVTDPASI